MQAHRHTSLGAHRKEERQICNGTHISTRSTLTPQGSVASSRLACNTPQPRLKLLRLQSVNRSLNQGAVREHVRKNPRNSHAAILARDWRKSSASSVLICWIPSHTVLAAANQNVEKAQYSTEEWSRISRWFSPRLAFARIQKTTITCRSFDKPKHFACRRRTDLKSALWLPQLSA